MAVNPMTAYAPRALSETKSAQLAAIFEIPSDRVTSFQKRLLQIVENIEHIRSIDDQQFRATRVARPLDHIEKLSSELQAAVTKLPTMSQAYLEWQAITDHPDGWGVIEGHCQHVAELGRIAARAAGKVRLALPTKGAPVGHRGRSNRRYRGLRSFVARVVHEALTAGGRVTLNKAAETGNLLTFLEEFRAHLPRDLLPPPEKHPVSTYQRVIEEMRAANRARQSRVKP